MPTRHRAGHLLYRGVVRIGDPDRLAVGIAKELRLVFVVLLERAISVEMVGCQIGEHADSRLEMGRVMQLEGGELQR
jgi:hypothetical protein